MMRIVNSIYLGIYQRRIVPETENKTGLEVMKLEYSLKLKIKRNDWLLASLRFILS